MKSRKKFAEWKRKTEALADQQGFKRLLKNDVRVKTEEQLETEYAKIGAQDDAAKRKDQREKYLKYKAMRNLSTSASFMIMLSVPEYLSKKLEQHVDSPFKMYEMI